MQKICKDSAAFSKSFVFVYFRFAGPCQPARLSVCDPHCWMCTVRLVLSSEVFVRACAPDALFLRSYVRDSDVRTCVTGCVRVYGVSDVARMISRSIEISCISRTFCSKLPICRNLFVCHDKFLTILASIVGYDSGL